MVRKDKVIIRLSFLKQSHSQPELESQATLREEITYPRFWDLCLMVE